MEETASRLRAKYDSLLETMDSELRLIQNNYIVLSIQKQKQYEEELNNLMKGLDNGLPFPEPTPQNPVNKDANSKLKEFQEKQKLLEKQKQLRLQQQLEYRQTVSICRDRINQVITQCRLQQESKESLLIPTAIDELHQYTTLLRKLASDLELLLVQRSEFTADDVQSAVQKHQESERIKLRFGGLLAQFQPPAPVPSVAPSTIATPNQPTIGASPIPQSAFSSITQPSTVTTPAKAAISTTSSSSGPDEFTNSAKNLYFQTQMELVKVEEVCSKFSGDKSKRQQVQLAIRARINTMCNEHISKLYEKTRKLLEILQGHRFEVSKGYVQVNSEDGSLHFAINCAVKAFIVSLSTFRQLIHSIWLIGCPLLQNVNVKQKNMAIKLAPVIAVLWSRVPLFGKIFLAHLYRNCPYAIPYFPEQEKDQTEEEYMVTCGYQPNSQGAITESDENFQERVYATIHLYSAVIQCNLREGHPRDLHYAWNWLSRVLNEPPKPRLTALILDAFLSVSAHKLLQCYGRQFQKMIAFITRTYLQKIEAITETTERQTFMKFKSLLSNIERKMRHGRLQDAVRQLASELDLVPDSFFN